jgi:hypothetical protein
MPSLSDTAYPRFKPHPSAKELNELYTPTVAELAFARERARQPVQRAGLLRLVKTFQRLGYFAAYAEIPAPIVRDVLRCAALSDLSEQQLQAYDASTARDRHTALVREFLSVTAYGPAAKQVIVETCLQAARARDDLPDLINMALEELIRQRFELPAFSTLLRIARATRNAVNRRYQVRVNEALGADARQRLRALLSRPAGASRSLWDQVKREPKRSTVPQFKDFLDHLRWLQEQNVAASAFAELPETKIRQFAAEARSLDLASLDDMPERKRLTLAGALILKQAARALDDVAEMFIRQVNKMHHKAEEALREYQVAHVDRTDALIGVLREIALAYKAEGPREERWALIDTLLEKDVDQILAQCLAHEAVAGNNPFFLPLFYSGRRSTLFLFLESVPLVSTSQDRVLLEAIACLLAHKGIHRKWLPISPVPSSADGLGRRSPGLDLSFVADKWWPLVTGTKDRGAAVSRVDRRYFELCVFTNVMLELKSGDLCLPGSDQFSDYRKELVSQEDFERGVALYGEQAGIPVEGPAFIDRLRAQLEAAAQRADDGFPANEYLRIENGEPVLKRVPRKAEPEGLARLEQQLADRMAAVDIIDALADTEHWLNWSRHFGPLSGHDAKLDHPRERYLITTFCYGCNLGPTQTARSIKGLDRRQVSFVNQRRS